MIHIYVKDYTLQKRCNGGILLNVRKSYELQGLISLGETLSTKKKRLDLQVIDNSGAVLWQGKGKPYKEVASLSDE